MLDNSPFYFSLIRKYVTLFGVTFDNIYINKTLDSNPSNNERVKVPISYINKDKLLARFDADPDIDRPYSALLPRMGFEMLPMTYDGSRKLPSTNYVSIKTTDGYIKQYVPVPYNFKFVLYIGVKNAEDGTKIIEQILPFFKPSYTPSVILIPETNMVHDIPIILNSVECEDKYDGAFENRRSLVWTLSFTMKGYIYGPEENSSVIRFVETDFFIPANTAIEDSVGVAPKAETVNVQVTLTANGQPTSNVADSIPYKNINITDDYGFSTTITNYE